MHCAWYIKQFSEVLSQSEKFKILFFQNSGFFFAISGNTYVSLMIILLFKFNILILKYCLLLIAEKLSEEVSCYSETKPEQKFGNFTVGLHGALDLCTRPRILVIEIDGTQLLLMHELIFSWLFSIVKRNYKAFETLY